MNNPCLPNSVSMIAQDMYPVRENNTGIYIPGYSASGIHIPDDQPGSQIPIWEPDCPHNSVLRSRKYDVLVGLKETEFLKQLRSQTGVWERE